jgi:ferredoxin
MNMFEIKNKTKFPFFFIMTETKQNKLVTRKIIKIDEDLCTGCGNCVVDCAEGALKVIDGKARVVNEVFCDGLGACIGSCNVGALKIIEREALEFDEEEVEKHLEGMKKNEQVDTGEVERIFSEQSHQCGCPSTQTMTFSAPVVQDEVSEKIQSTLRQWPIQMHLINPQAPYYQGADVLIAADCVAYSYGDFHRDFMKEKSIAIACPKLDQGRESYIEKIRSLIDDAKINTLTVVMMEVPCCGGLLGMTQQAVDRAIRKVPIKRVVIGIKGGILSEEWI